VNYFITGTDTDVGKTFVTALWVRELRRIGIDAVGMKPLCCGDRADAELLHAASDGAATLNELNPIWLRTPAAPYAASMIEERMLDLDAILKSYAALAAAHRAVLIEGAGGWLVPIRRDYAVADLAADLGAPVVIVVRNRLGALNHTLLTVRDIAARGLVCAGLIINNMDGQPDAATTTNRALLEELAGVPILFEIDRDQTELSLAIV
jgi:dethiobiotin synthetase